MTGRYDITTTAEPTYQVKFRSGKVYTLTQAQLDANPQLQPYAKLVTTDVIEVEEDQDFADDPRPGRLPSSSRRYSMPDAPQPPRVENREYVVPRKRAHAAPDTEDVPRTRKQRRGGVVGALRDHPLVAIIFGMAILALLAWGVSSLASWWQNTQQDWMYGRPRTYQLDAVVGHGDSAANPSHFIFLNLNRHVVIIELPGGDTSKARIYNGPTLFGDGQDLTPVTAEFRDVNGDGKPDMIVHIQDQTLVYLNDGTQFVPLKPGQHVNLGN